MATLQMTIDSDAEDVPTPKPAPTKKGKRKREVLEAASSKTTQNDEFAHGFAFDTLGGNTQAGLSNFGSNDFFSRRNLQNSDDSMGEDDSEDDEDVTDTLEDAPFAALTGEQDEEASFTAQEDFEGLESDSDNDSEGPDANETDFAALNGMEASSDPEDEDDQEAPQQQDNDFFEQPENMDQQDEVVSFADIPNGKLSRPILLGLSSMGLQTPTPVQVQTIPCVLVGKDVVGSAVTGSGKTIAFWCGVIERLLYRDKRNPATRVITICPTRELAQQVLNVGQTLARYTDITFALCVGGLSLKAQEAQLKQRPDVVVCTPGRLIDHVRNTQSFSLDTVEILIIDEADRILEEGFKDELTEIIRFCPFGRSTLLFSATMNENVKDLAQLTLNKPVRVKVDALDATSSTLVQEFLKIKGDWTSRESTLVAICRMTFTSRTLIFVRSKASAHRLKMLFDLLGLKAAELHGNLSQEQRMGALQQFKEEQVEFLIATDLASRGLDIRGIESVINFEMPKTLEIYLHRVGRTARAGKAGRSLTLVGEEDRKLVKQAIKKAKNVKQRKIDSKLVKQAATEIKNLQSDMRAAAQQEQEDKEMRRTEMEIRKGENLIKYEDDIKGRPQRTWFQSERDKQASKSKGEDTAEPSGDKPGRKRPKNLNHKQRRRLEARREEEGSSKSLAAGIRSAKRAAKPSKMTKMRAPTSASSPKQKKTALKKGAANARPKAKPTGKKMGKAKSSASVSSKSKGKYKSHK